MKENENSKISLDGVKWQKGTDEAQFIVKYHKQVTEKEVAYV